MKNKRRGDDEFLIVISIVAAFITTLILAYTFFTYMSAISV